MGNMLEHEYVLDDYNIPEDKVPNYYNRGMGNLCLY